MVGFSLSKAKPLFCSQDTEGRIRLAKRFVDSRDRSEPFGASSPDALTSSTPLFSWVYYQLPACSRSAVCSSLPREQHGKSARSRDQAPAGLFKMPAAHRITEETKPCINSSNKLDIVTKAKDQNGVDLHNPVYKPTTTEDSQRILPQVFASFIMAFFHIAVGYALAFSAIMIPQIKDENSFVKVTNGEAAWIASSMVLFTPVGAIMAGFFMEAWGRVNTIKIAIIPGLLGWLLIAIGTNFYMLLLGRIFTGLSSALATSPAIVYITEVAKPEYRGALISMCPTIASLGMLIAYAMGAYLDYQTCAWAAFPYLLVPVLLVIMWAPESPTWLVARGRIDEAEASLIWLAGSQSSFAQQRLAAMVKSQDMKALVSTDFKSRVKVFLKPTGYKPLVILTGLFLLQQFSGIYMTLFYTVDFIKEIGSSINVGHVSIMVGGVRFLMSFVNTLMLKNFGRRPLIMISGVGMFITMGTSGFLTHRLFANGESGIGPVICLMLYICTSMLGLLSIPWTMTAELFPTEIRGLAQGVVLSIAHLSMWCAVQLYPTLVDILQGGAGIQWFFAIVSLCASLFVFILLPETHNKPLIEIENYFNDNFIYLCQKKPSVLAQVELSNVLINKC